MKVPSFVNRNKFFFIPMVFLLTIGIFFVLSFSKDEIHIFQNTYYSPFLDYFFQHLTYLGDYHVLLPIIFISAFIKWRYFLGFVLVGLLSVCAIVVLKYHLFIDHPRPPQYFAQIHELRLIEGVEILTNNSFPSGHTTSAFAFYALMAFFLNTKRLKLALFITAALVGYSRIYLSQHFLIDVLVGSILGTFLALITYWVVMKVKLPILNKGLIQSLSKD